MSLENSQKDKKRVLIGIPGYAGVQPECQQAIFSLALRTGRELGQDYDFAIQIVVKSEQFRARNRLVNAAIGGDFDYLLMLDDDMQVPSDLISRLIAHDKDVVGALYYQRGGAFHPVIMKKFGDDIGNLHFEFLNSTDPIVTERGLHEVDVIGGGCMLFKTDIFKKLMPPYFDYEKYFGTDISICNRLQEAGCKIFVDTSIELGHMGDREMVTSRSVPLAQRELGAVKETLFKDVRNYLGMSEEELKGEMGKAATSEYRADKWREEDRSDWEGVKKFYQTGKEWHLTNLLLWNLQDNCQIKEWALSSNKSIINAGHRIIDYGSGLGHLSIALAMTRNADVFAMDIADSPTGEFVKWRAKHHDVRYDGRDGGSVDFRGINQEVPMMQFNCSMDGAFMVSVVEHLMDPYGVIEWVMAQVKPGGFLACDYLHGTAENNPQHLDRLDVPGFDRWMHDRGWETSPEFPWLFFNKRN